MRFIQRFFPVPGRVASASTETPVEDAAEQREAADRPDRAERASQPQGANLPTAAPAPAYPVPTKGLRPGEVGSSLLDAIAEAVARHVVLPVRGAEMTALWTIHVHAHEAAQHSPLYAIQSPDSACGKTTLLRVLGGLTPNPVTSIDVSVAGLYRSTAAQKRTWLFDEANTSVGNNSLLRALFRGGHCRDTAQIVRADGIFDAWSPKALAFIGEIPQDLRNRSLRIGLQRKLSKQAVAPLDHAALSHLQHLCARSAAWVAAHLPQLLGANPKLLPELSNRTADNWRPLLAIADLAGGHWPETARAIAIMSSAVDTDVSPGVALLADIKRVFAAVDGDRIPSAELVAALAAMEDRPWGEWNRGRSITPNQVAALLRPWSIAPRTIRFSTGVAKGYLAADFRDAFNRYT